MLPSQVSIRGDTAWLLSGLPYQLTVTSLEEADRVANRGSTQEKNGV